MTSLWDMLYVHKNAKKSMYISAEYIYIYYYMQTILNEMKNKHVNTEMDTDVIYIGGYVWIYTTWVDICSYMQKETER